jgi:hypothetical protein
LLIKDLAEMTAQDFRRIALSLPESVESSHMDHPDFRVAGKIFATLDAPGKGWGMVKLWPDQQAELLEADPKAFKPAAGAWGVRGATLVCLSAAKIATVRRALADAWRNTAPKRLAGQLPASE